MKIVKTRAYIDKLKGHKQSILEIYSPQGPSGSLMYSLSMGGELLLWDIYEKKIKNSFTLQFPHIKQTDVSHKRISVAVFSQKILYTGLFNGRVFSWSIQTGELIDEFVSHKEEITAIKKINSLVLVTGDKTGVLNLWDTASGNLDKSFIFKGAVTDFIYNHLSLHLVLNRKTIASLDLQTKALTSTKQFATDRYVVKMFQAEDLIFLQMSDFMLQCYETLNNDCVWKVFLDSTWVNTIKNVDDEYLMCGCEDSSLRVLSLRQHKQVNIFHGHFSCINSLQLSFGRLYTAGSDYNILQWDLQQFSHQLRQRRMMHAEQLQSLRHEAYMKVMDKSTKRAKRKTKSKSKLKQKKIK